MATAPNKLSDQESREELSFPEMVWLEVGKQAILGSPEKITEGGKQIIALSTVLSGAYFTAIAFAKLGIIGSRYVKILYVAPVLFWVIAILFAIPAVVPLKRYGTNLGDPLSGKNLFFDMVIGKLKWLRLGLIFQILGIIAMLIVLWFHLSGITGATSTQ